MKMTYDHMADAMYITLTENLIIGTKRINDNFLLDLDEAGQVVGIEVLDVRKSGIDPLTLLTMHYTPDHHPEREKPDPEEIKARRAEIAQARKRMRDKQTQS